MRVLRGFPAQGVVACFTEPVPPASQAEQLDINSPCNAPAANPMAHLDRVAFHSSFFNYELAVPMQTITVTHPRVVTSTTVWGAPGAISVSITGTGREDIRSLLTHNLGYTPLVMVSYQDVMVISGTAVQVEAQGARFISVWANNSEVGLGESAYCGPTDLPEAARTYQVMVFRTPAPNPALPLFSGDNDSFQIGRGMINSDRSYLKRDPNGVFDMDLGRTLDITNGGARMVSGGVTRSDNWYNGGFTGSPFIPVGV